MCGSELCCVPMVDVIPTLRQLLSCRKEESRQPSPHAAPLRRGAGRPPCRQRAGPEWAGCSGLKMVAAAGLRVVRCGGSPLHGARAVFSADARYGRGLRVVFLGGCLRRGVTAVASLSAGSCCAPPGTS